MACHKSGGPPAGSVATLGGKNHHLRVDGLHLWCPTTRVRLARCHSCRLSGVPKAAFGDRTEIGPQPLPGRPGVATPASPCQHLVSKNVTRGHSTPLSNTQPYTTKCLVRTGELPEPTGLEEFRIGFLNRVSEV
jgi:hypothetical protein